MRYFLAQKERLCHPLVCATFKKMSRKISIHHPKPIYLPDGIEREILLKGPAVNARLLTEEQRRKYDSKTLFFDVFLSADRQTLTCLGPHFVNLGPPRAVRCQGQPLEFIMPMLDARLYLESQLSLLCISLKTAPRRGSLSITLEFADFEIDIPCPPSAPRLPDKKVELMLTTMQKDNPLPWIKDWCQWHARVHGVQRVVLYENGSSTEYSPEELSSELAELDVEVLLVNWPFPFGPPLPYQKNQFIQNGNLMEHHWRFTHVGALNHCRLLFGDLCQWCINMDLDEYLYLQSPLPLREYLRRRTRDPVVYMKYYYMETLVILKDQLPRFFDYSLRRLNVTTHDIKYVYQPERILYNAHHYVLSTDDSVLEIPWNWEKIHQTRRARLLQRRSSFFKKLWREAKHRLLSTPKKTDAATEPEIFYYNLRTLNTGWDYPDRSWRSADDWLRDKTKRFFLLCLPDALLVWLKSLLRSTQFVRDERLKERAQKAGLLPS